MYNIYISYRCTILWFIVFKGCTFKWLSDKESTCPQCRRHRRCGFDPWVKKIPWRRKWQLTPVFLPAKPCGQRSGVTKELDSTWWLKNSRREKCTEGTSKIYYIFSWLLAFWGSQLTWEDLVSQTSFHSSEFLWPCGQRNLSWLVLLTTEPNSHLFISILYTVSSGFPGGSDGEESTCNAGDWGSVPGSGWSPGEVHGNPLQYSCLENPMDRGAWRATLHSASNVDTTEWLSTAHHSLIRLK